MSKQLFDCVDLTGGGTGVIVHVYEGVMPPTYLVETFHDTSSPSDKVITLQEQVDGTLRRLALSLKDIPHVEDQGADHADP